MGTLARLIVYFAQMQHTNTTRSVGLPKDPLNMVGGCPPIAIMPGAGHNQVGKCKLVIMAGPN